MVTIIENLPRRCVHKAQGEQEETITDHPDHVELSGHRHSSIFKFFDFQGCNAGPSKNNRAIYIYIEPSTLRSLHERPIIRQQNLKDAAKFMRKIGGTRS